MMLLDPFGRAILVGDRVDTNLTIQRGQLLGGTRRLDLPDRLGQLARPAPNGKPDRPRIVAFQYLDDPLRRLRIHARANLVRVAVVTILDQIDQLLVRWIVRPVLAEVGQHLAVGIDRLADQFRPRRLIMAVTESGTQPFDFEVATVQQEPHHRLPVIRIAPNVGHNNDSRLGVSWVAGSRHDACDGDHGQSHHSCQRYNHSGRFLRSDHGRDLTAEVSLHREILLACGTVGAE